jgi:hypothetical protein
MFSKSPGTRGRSFYFFPVGRRTSFIPHPCQTNVTKTLPKPYPSLAELEKLASRQDFLRD